MEKKILGQSCVSNSLQEYSSFACSDKIPIFTVALRILQWTPTWFNCHGD
jgi:hypothetical protein